jgi:hypothetical protein
MKPTCWQQWQAVLTINPLTVVLNSSATLASENPTQGEA